MRRLVAILLEGDFARLGLDVPTQLQQLADEVIE
jgi:hypothetical protein